MTPDFYAGATIGVFAGLLIAVTIIWAIEYRLERKHRIASERGES